jgi:hypothetical protein
MQNGTNIMEMLQCLQHTAIFHQSNGPISMSLFQGHNGKIKRLIHMSIHCRTIVMLKIETTKCLLEQEY